MKGIAIVTLGGLLAVRSAAAEPEHGPLAVGVEAGEPTSATVGWMTGPVLVAGAIGTGTVSGAGLSLHADVYIAVAHLKPAIPLRVGLGLRHYHHGYTPASMDELPDTHDGIRASVALVWQGRSLELYGEVSPGFDFRRTMSCSLASGVDSICPHAMEGPLFVNLAVGARWFFNI